MKTDSNGLKEEDGECLLPFGFIHMRKREREDGFFYFLFFINLKEKEKRRGIKLRMFYVMCI